MRVNLGFYSYWIALKFCAVPPLILHYEQHKDQLKINSIQIFSLKNFQLTMFWNRDKKTFGLFKQAIRKAPLTLF